MAMARIFSKPHSISQYLKCTLCYEVYTQPLRLFCGHTLCSQCLGKITANSKKSQALCAICRTPIIQKQIGVDLIAQKMIMDLEGTLANLEQHYNACQHKLMTDSQTKKGGSTEINAKQIIFEDEQLTQTMNHNIAKGSLLDRIKLRNGPVISNSSEIIKQPKIISKTATFDFLQQLFDDK